MSNRQRKTSIKQFQLDQTIKIQQKIFGSKFEKKGRGTPSFFKNFLTQHFFCDIFCLTVGFD